MGREVQLSFYAGPAFYNPNGKCNKLFMGQEWPWNPIGAGDIKGNHGAILSQSFGKTAGHIVTRPLQWACDNVPCECEFEQQFTLGGPANTGVKVVATLHNHRADKTAYPPRSQELPAGLTRTQTRKHSRLPPLSSLLERPLLQTHHHGGWAN
jgi:hypothetical protein